VVYNAHRLRVKALLTLLGLVFFASCGPSWTVRHWDVTIEVDTPAGLRIGRGVVETRARKRNEWLYTMDSAQLIVHGEAIAVSLPNGLLVAPIASHEYGFFSLSGRTGDSFYTRRDSFRERERAAIAANRGFELLAEGWPPLIFFPDPSDPRSAEEVPQAADLSVSGKGFTVRRITVQETDAPITRTIEATLPWLKALPTSGARISGKTDHIAPDRIFADRLWRAQFTTFEPGED
jgi:hypothetical protein